MHLKLLTHLMYLPASQTCTFYKETCHLVFFFFFWQAFSSKALSPHEPLLPGAFGSSNRDESKQGKTQQTGAAARHTSDGQRRHLWPFKVCLTPLFPCQLASLCTVTAMCNSALMCTYNRQAMSFNTGASDFVGLIYNGYQMLKFFCVNRL